MSGKKGKSGDVKARYKRTYLDREVKHLTEKDVPMIEDLLWEHFGSIEKVSATLNIRYQLLVKFIKRYNLSRTMLSARQRIVDMAEEKLIENIKKGKERSIFFALETLGKAIYNRQDDVKVQTQNLIVYLPKKQGLPVEDKILESSRIDVANAMGIKDRGDIPKLTPPREAILKKNKEKKDGEKGD